MLPESGRSTPPRQFNSVDLPLPDAPRQGQAFTGTDLQGNSPQYRPPGVGLHDLPCHHHRCAVRLNSGFVVCCFYGFVIHGPPIIPFLFRSLASFLPPAFFIFNTTATNSLSCDVSLGLAPLFAVGFTTGTLAAARFTLPSQKSAYGQPVARKPFISTVGQPSQTRPSSGCQKPSQPNRPVGLTKNRHLFDHASIRQNSVNDTHQFFSAHPINCRVKAGCGDILKCQPSIPVSLFQKSRLPPT